MNHHPDLKLIDRLAKGEIISPLGTMLSAHIELCSSCREYYQQVIESDSSSLLDSNLALTENEIDSAFNLLMTKIDTDGVLDVPEVDDEAVINISGESFVLPSALSFLKDEKIAWKEFGKKNAIAPISTSKDGNFYLIYIGPGESVPEHSHTQVEYSYVAAGSYEDGFSTFETGDFSLATHSDRHTPVATSHDGCLVISWVEGRLNYFKGIFSPLNRLLWWYLHRA